MKRARSRTQNCVRPWPAVCAVAALLTVSVPLHAEGSTGASLELDAFVSLVLERGLAAKLAESRAAEAEAAVHGAGLWPNPSVGLSRGHSVLGGRAGESDDGVTVSIPLVLSGRLGLEHAAAQDRAEAAAARRSRARGEIRHEATRAYLQAVAAQRRVDVITRALVSLDEVARVVVAREEAGEAAGYDRARIELERARLQDQHRAAAASHIAARAVAARLSGLGAEELRPFSAALPPPEATGDAQALLAHLLATRADLRALEHATRAAERSAEAAGRRLFPDPVLTAGPSLLDLGSPTWGAGYSVGLSVPLPLFDRGQGAERVALARRDTLRVERERLTAAATARLEGALAVLTAEREMIERHEADVVRRAAALTTIVETAYGAGGATLLALVDAQGAHRQALLRAIDLTLRARLTENDIRQLTGTYDNKEEGTP